MDADGDLWIGILLMALPLNRPNNDPGKGLKTKCILSEPTTRTHEAFDAEFEYESPAPWEVHLASAADIETGKELAIRMEVTVVDEGKTHSPAQSATV